MSYVQIKLTDGFITRSPTLAPSARIGGYPGYMATTHDDRSTVRTILYEDDTGIYLTKKKQFHLVEGINGNLVFSSNTSIDPIIPEGRRYPWYEEWANMDNSRSDRVGLIHPYDHADDAWNLVASNNYDLTFAISGKGHIGYIRPCNIFICQDYGYFHASSSPAVFRLKKYGSDYGLTYDDIGRSIGAGGRRDVRCWNTANACRWMIHGGTSGSYPVIRFKPRHQSNGTYHLLSGDKPLSSSGSWYIASLAITVNDGTEFYTNPAITVTPTIRGMTSSDMYRVRSFLNYDGAFNRMSVRENLPDGTSCSGNYWNGIELACYNERVPYDYDTGLVHCTTLDDMTNDQHCQIWAITNAGPSIDDIMRSMCKEEQPGGSHANICNCYLPDDIYYETILEESGNRVANGVRASSLLQCASGLCSGSGTIGEDIFYSGSRRCDVCIQVMTANINADKIEGGVSLRQQCTHVDTTYSWDQLLDDLISYGAYHQEEGLHRHVIINPARTAIMLVGATNSTLLMNMPSQDGRTIIYKTDWNKSPTAMSNEILAFFLERQE